MNEYHFNTYEEVRTVAGQKAHVVFYLPDKMAVDVFEDIDHETCRTLHTFFCEPDGTDGHGNRLIYHTDEWKELVGPYADLFDIYKPGDMVLIACRNQYDFTNIWRIAQLSHIIVKKAGDKYDLMFVLTHGSVRRKRETVMPLKGNEHLVGTKVL